jgi:hypothetical protein
MITSMTYRARVDRKRDVLAAFSALDHGTTGSMDEFEVAVSYRQLLARITALLFLRGPDTPGVFLRAVECDNANLVAVTTSFLEYSSPEVSGCEASELQQELVHFSRIVDVGAAGFDDPRAERALRRVRNSHRLPEPLTVLSELVIVMRSRRLQRGADLELPSLRAGRLVIEDPTDSWAMARSSVAADYVVLVQADRRRDRRQACYLFTALLEYLTPVEAAAAVWAYLSGTESPPPGTMP